MVQYSRRPAQATCPVCNSNDIVNLYVVSAEESAQHFVRKEADAQRYSLLLNRLQTLWEANTCAVNRCNQCQFCFADPYVAGDLEFYSIAHPRHGYPKWKWENQVTLDAVREASYGRDLSKTRLLEIGAGNGAFVRRIKQFFPVSNIVCTEYSEFGVKQIKSIGADCYLGDVKQLDNRYNGYFDFVCLFQVLEHLDDLDGLAEKLDAITKEDASLYIAVPNDRFIEFIETNNASLDMPPNHIGRWNKSAFEFLAKKRGWEIVSHEYQRGESKLAMANRFCVYRYLYESQKGGSFANHVARFRNRYFRFAVMQIVAKFYGLGSLGGLVRSLSGKYCMAQWVCIKKHMGR